MTEPKKFSLSHYFDELNRRQAEPGFQTRSAGPPPGISTVDLLAVLKALKATEDQQLPLTLLAKSAGMKIGYCEEIASRLADEGLIEIMPDDQTGNDRIVLTEKGMVAL